MALVQDILRAESNFGTESLLNESRVQSSRDEEQMLWSCVYFDLVSLDLTRQMRIPRR